MTARLVVPLAAALVGALAAPPATASGCTDLASVVVLCVADDGSGTLAWVVGTEGALPCGPEDGCGWARLNGVVWFGPDGYGQSFSHRVCPATPLSPECNVVVP